MLLRRLTAMTLTAVLVLPAMGSAADEPASFEALIDDIGHTMLARFPQDATDLGISAELGLDDTRLNDLSADFDTETAGIAGEALVRLAAIDPSSLSADERITLAVAEWYLRDIVSMARFADHAYAVNFITGAHVDFGEFMADVHPLDDLADAEAYIARLKAAGGQLAQVAAAVRRGETTGNLPTQRGLAIAGWQIANQLVPVEHHPLLVDFAARLEGLGLEDAERDRLIAEAKVVIAERLMPAFEVLESTVRSAAVRSDDQPGVLHHPDGDEYYAAVLAHHLSTRLTPAEVHEIGLGQVERVRDELVQAMAAHGVDVDGLGFVRAIETVSRSMPVVPLRSDADREALLNETEAFIAGTEDSFEAMFTTLPASPIEVQRPRPGREGAGGAYYRPPPVTGDRPGIYYLSLGGDTFPMDTYATTNHHEAVPGHHFQLALQREAEDLPLVQRATTFTGYAEGWALYAERLAAEAGQYEDDPLGNIGRLRMELLRAARAVADTGIHALGWSRDEAIDYLVELGFPEPWAASEVDRYIVWPGQAPSYLIGMLEILRLRDEAAAALGDDFDIAGFHDAVLRHGSIPLEVLPMAVEAWLESAAHSSG